MAAQSNSATVLEPSDEAFARALTHALLCLNLSLKREQVDAVKKLARKKDVFIWFPTGFGKSICYQLLPFVFNSLLCKTNAPLVEQSVVLVVSPLIFLMVDQVNSLRRRSVSAAILSSNKGIDQSLKADVSAGRYRLLYTTPEAIVGWTKVMLASPLCTTLVAITIDEAHCVYKW